jgi:hypothetical protein
MRVAVLGTTKTVRATGYRQEERKGNSHEGSGRQRSKSIG